MSYDLLGYRARPGESPDVTATTLVRREAGFVEVSTPRVQVPVPAHEASVTILYRTDGAEESSTVRDGYRASAEVALPALRGAAAPPPASSGAPTARPRAHRWPFGRRKKED